MTQLFVFYLILYLLLNQYQSLCLSLIIIKTLSLKMLHSPSDFNSLLGPVQLLQWSDSKHVLILSLGCPIVRKLVLTLSSGTRLIDFNHVRDSAFLLPSEQESLQMLC